MDSRLSSVFVPFIPIEGNTQRDGSLAPSWHPFVNAFNTWMDQAQSVVKLTENLFCVRIGALVVVTGYVKKDEKIDIVAPMATFSSGNVLFSAEGFIQNNGGYASVNVTYITKE